MCYYDDDYDEQYEEYYIQYEEEEIIYVNGGILIDEFDDLYYPSYREEIMYDFPVVKKDLKKMLEACENMSRCYRSI